MSTSVKPVNNPPAQLPPYKVLLHNDKKNDMAYVVKTVVELTPIKESEAIQRMQEAHKTGVSLLMVTHKERAEFYQDRLKSKGLTVTVEAEQK